MIILEAMEYVGIDSVVVVIICYFYNVFVRLLYYEMFMGLVEVA